MKKTPTNRELVRAIFKSGMDSKVSDRQAVIGSFRTADLLLPVSALDDGDAGIGIVPRLQFLRRDINGQKVMVVFTDIESLVSWSDRPMTHMVIDGDNLIENARIYDVSTIVINPGGAVTTVISMSETELSSGNNCRKAA